MNRLYLTLAGAFALVTVVAERPWRLECSADLVTWTEIDCGLPGMWIIQDNAQQPALFWRLMEE